jgi:integrase
MSDTKALVPTSKQTGELANLVVLVAAASALASKSKAPRTQTAYRSDWANFTGWCSSTGLAPLPAAPEAVALYITARAAEGRKVSTICRELVAISQAHKVAGHTSPTSDAKVSAVLKGLKREKGTAPNQKAPVMVEELRRMVEALPVDSLGVRDRALLTMGFAGAFRRSELVALNVADLDFTADGLVVMLRRSKTDQAGAGRKVGIPYGGNPSSCPVRSLRRWLDLAGIVEGPVFRGIDRAGGVLPDRLSDLGVARAVKRAAASVGLDPTRFSGHSLRAGLATSAAKAGKSLMAIKRQTGHRSDRMVQQYIRTATLFDDNAAGGIGL